MAKYLAAVLEYIHRSDPIVSHDFSTELHGSPSKIEDRYIRGKSAAPNSCTMGGAYTDYISCTIGSVFNTYIKYTEQAIIS